MIWRNRKLPKTEHQTEIAEPSASSQMIQLNARWRVTVIRSGVSGRPAWMLEELADDAWQARAMLRGAAMLRAWPPSWPGCRRALTFKRGI
jgi:hypothetical protein